MRRESVESFGATAKSLSRNPLGIIALFIVLVYGLACLVLITGANLTPTERVPMVYFLIVFPVLVLSVFAYLVAFRAGQLFSPGDFQSDQTYLELQKMQLTAVASLAAAKQIRIGDQPGTSHLDIDKVVRSVNNAAKLTHDAPKNPLLLWVDDNPDNNIYERKAFEAIGFEFILSEYTEDAIEKIHEYRFDAIISDMGRREGPREGYVLLDRLRAQNIQTPFFIYASSRAPQHIKETIKHGGQGCTNDGQELFDMVTRSVIGSKYQ